MWAAGMGILVLHSLVSYIRLWRRVRTAVRLEESVYESEFTDTPFVLGIVRPRIYLPAHMPEEMRVPVLAHERAHLRRLDNLWKMAGYALLCAYWFHPLVWAAYSLFCRDLELACDESVIKGYDAHRRRLYSAALLVCSLDRRGALGYPLTFGEVGVRERIKAVIRYKKPGFWMAVAAVAACIAVAICFLTDPMDSGDAQPLPSGAGGEAEADGNAGGDSRYAAGNRSGTKQGTVPDGQGSNGGDRFGGTGTEADGPDGGSGAVGDDGGKPGSAVARQPRQGTPEVFSLLPAAHPAAGAVPGAGDAGGFSFFVSHSSIPPWKVEIRRSPGRPGRKSKARGACLCPPPGLRPAR